MELRKYEYLWTTEKEKYVLLKTSDGDYGILNVERKSGLIIEDDKLYQDVIKSMIKNGNRIIEKPSDL